MTIGYLKRKKDQFLEELEFVSKERMMDKDFQELSLRISKTVLNAFIKLIEKESK